jgi:hypothetical protein
VPAALEAAHVNLVAGAAFGTEGYARMSFATSREQISAALLRASPAGMTALYDALTLGIEHLTTIAANRLLIDDCC